MAVVCFCLGQAVPPDITVEQARDWLDYVFALGGLLTGAAAVAIALVSVFQAREASQAATRTADAAEKTAAAAREELEMLKAEAARKPAFEIHPELLPYADDPHTTVLQLGMRNVGQRDADNTVVNVLVPQGATIAHCDGPNGRGGRAVPLLPTKEPEQPGASLKDWVYLIDRLNQACGIPNVAFFRITFPDAGSYVVRIKLGHPDARISADIVADIEESRV